MSHHTGPVRSVPGMRLVEHRLRVPLTADDHDERTIEIFAREVRAAAHADDDRPHLLMLNGGPGSAAQRPLRPGAWLERALHDFHVVLLDQRGTGLSTPATRQTLPAIGDAAAQAAYLSHFRADAIVRDAEHLRRVLLGDDGRWTLLGQSFGGFVALTYLSHAPHALREVTITGGLPSLHRPALDVYRATLRRQDAKIAAYLERYPDDGERWAAVLEHVAATEEHTPRGRRLTPDAVRTAGRDLGMSTGPEQLHYLVERAFAGNRLSEVFLEGLEERISFARDPLYAILHEAIYAQGEATRWAAQRALDDRAGGPPAFYGEVVLPSMVAEDPALAPLRETVELLVAQESWPSLYDAEILGANTVPIAAAVYLEDPYVESAFSLETAAGVGALRAWVTNEHDHDGVHVGPVLDRLIAMHRGEA